MKLTDWYNADQKPVRVGVYERSYKLYPSFYDRSYYCWWNGRSFGFGRDSPKLCSYLKMSEGASLIQDLPWRGVQK